MPSQYRHRRSQNAAAGWPSTIEPGEIAVNTANRQIVVGDAAAGTTGTPLPLLGVRVFDNRAIYSIGEYVWQAGALYRCKAPHGPAAFDPANFSRVRDVDTAVVAGEVVNTPAGGISATTVQAALNELDGEKAPKANPAFTGVPTTATTPAAGDNSKKLATTEYTDRAIVTAALPVATAAPLMDGAAAVGAAGKYATEGHRHPTDTTRAPLNAPVFTGDPARDTSLAPADNSTKLATTEFANATALAAAGAAVGAATTVKYTAQALGVDQQLQARQNIDAAASVSAIGKNRLINGSFKISQEFLHTNPALPHYSYGVDGWRVMVEAGNAVLLSDAFNFTATNEPNGIAQVGNAGVKWGMFQGVEYWNQNDLAGTVVTLSAKIGVGNLTGMPSVKMALLQWSGTPDSFINPIAAWNAAGTNPTLVSGWTYVAVSANLNAPQIPAGPVFALTGTVAIGARNLGVLIWCDGKVNIANDALCVARVQLEAGPYATTFERRLLGQELALCQRYWACTNAAAPKGVPVGAVTMTSFHVTALLNNVRLPVTMRAIPAMSLWHNGVQNEVRISATGINVPVAGPVSFQASTDNVTNVISSGSPFTVNQFYDFDLIADARL